MFRRTASISFILLFLIVLLWGSTQSIVSSKLLELQVHIEKDFIQNFELSSQLLEIQFNNLAGEEGNIYNEINQQVLASSILNEIDSEVIEVTWLNTAGIGIINSIRLLSLKPLLVIWKEMRLVSLLKYAFYLERNRRLNDAIKQYELIIKTSNDKNSSTRAFALLHQSYCYAVIGKLKIAKTNLIEIQKKFKGTQHHRTALILYRLITQKEIFTKQIKMKYNTPKELAKALFETGDMKEAKSIYDTMKFINEPMDQYRYARTKEEVGQVNKAIVDYKRVITKNTYTKAAKLANQRLLLIGGFYGGGKKTREFAEKKANILGNQKVANDISQVVRRLPTNAVARESKIIQKTQQEIEEELKKTANKQSVDQINKLSENQKEETQIKALANLKVEEDTPNEEDIEISDHSQLPSKPQVEAKQGDLFLTTSDQEKIKEGGIKVLEKRALLKNKKKQTYILNTKNIIQIAFSKIKEKYETRPKLIEAEKEIKEEQKIAQKIQNQRNQEAIKERQQQQEQERKRIEEIKKERNLEKQAKAKQIEEGNKKKKEEQKIAQEIQNQKNQEAIKERQQQQEQERKRIEEIKKERNLEKQAKAKQIEEENKKKKEEQKIAQEIQNQKNQEAIKERQQQQEQERKRIEEIKKERNLEKQAKAKQIEEENKKKKEEQKIAQEIQNQKNQKAIKERQQQQEQERKRIEEIKKERNLEKQAKAKQIEERRESEPEVQQSSKKAALILRKVKSIETKEEKERQKKEAMMIAKYNQPDQSLETKQNGNDHVTTTAVIAQKKEEEKRLAEERKKQKEANAIEAIRKEENRKKEEQEKREKRKQEKLAEAAIIAQKKEEERRLSEERKKQKEANAIEAIRKEENRKKEEQEKREKRKQEKLAEAAIIAQKKEEERRLSEERKKQKEANAIEAIRKEENRKKEEQEKREKRKQEKLAEAAIIAQKKEEERRLSEERKKQKEANAIEAIRKEENRKKEEQEKREKRKQEKLAEAAIIAQKKEEERRLVEGGNKTQIDKIKNSNSYSVENKQFEYQKNIIRIFFDKKREEEIKFVENISIIAEKIIEQKEIAIQIAKEKKINEEEAYSLAQKKREIAEQTIKNRRSGGGLEVITFSDAKTKEEIEEDRAKKVESFNGLLGMVKANQEKKKILEKLHTSPQKIDQFGIFILNPGEIHKIEIEKNPSPYLIVTLNEDRKIWAKDINQVREFFRLKTNETGFLIRKERLLNAKIVLVKKGNIINSNQPTILIFTKKGKFHTARSIHFNSKEQSIFLDDGKILPFTDLDKITSFDLLQ